MPKTRRRTRKTRRRNNRSNRKMYRGGSSLAKNFPVTTAALAAGAAASAATGLGCLASQGCGYFKTPSPSEIAKQNVEEYSNISDELKNITDDFERDFSTLKTNCISKLQQLDNMSVSNIEWQDGFIRKVYDDYRAVQDNLSNVDVVTERTMGSGNSKINDVSVLINGYEKYVQNENTLRKLRKILNNQEIRNLNRLILS